MQVQENSALISRSRCLGASFRHKGMDHVIAFVADRTYRYRRCAEYRIHIDAPHLRVFVFALFFIFGGITSLNDVTIPKLKEL